MTWFSSLLITLAFLVFSMIFWLLFGYVVGEQMVGREAARRNLRYNIPGFLFGFFLAFILLFFGRYVWVSFYILSAASIDIWLISWFFRKQEAGALLVNVGRTSINKFLFWLGLMQVALTFHQTWLFSRLAVNGLPEYTSLDLEISRLVFYWSFAAYFIAIGLNKLELRRDGICFIYSLIKWERINSYAWEMAKPNVLTIRFKPRLPLWPRFMSIAIPEKHKDVVSHILHEQLLGKSL